MFFRPLSTGTTSRWLSVCLLALCGVAHAAVLTVGSPVGTGNCSHANVQAAINAAESSPGPDTIRVTRSISHLQQALQINTAQELDVIGGYATCAQSDSDGAATILDGAGGAQEPVLRITTQTGGLVRLRDLAIRNGDEDGDGYGGGIYFRGNGLLEIRTSSISNNLAGYGGGIYAEGTGTDAELAILEGVTISANSARYSGGGLYIDGLEATLQGPDSVVAFNKAIGVFNPGTGQTVGGYGGGAQVVGGARDGYLYIGSPGIGGTGAVYANEARYGGGVSVMSVSEEAIAQLWVYSTVVDRQTSIRDNFASIAGGGLYLWAEDRGGFVIGYMASARLHNASLLDNAAPTGAAAYLAPTPGLFPVGYSGLHVNTEGSAHASALPCPTDRPCSFIRGNVDQDTNGQPTGGPVIHIDTDNGVYMERVELSGNRGGRILYAIGGDTVVESTNTLWAGNQTSAMLLDTDDGVDLLLENSTLAGNAIGASQVIDANGRFRMQRSVLWQEGKTSLTHSGGTRTVQNVVTSERQSLDGGSTPYVLEANPRFVDAARQDYRLRAASPAVDWSDTGGGPDLTGVERGIDLPVKSNRFGSADLGAHERPALLPLIHNGTYDGDLNLWSGPQTTWDISNAAGGAGSGSAFVQLSNAPGPRLEGASQCIHLPGPGRYRLNGAARVPGTQAMLRDYAYLRWELRHDGGEACNAGPPDAAADHFLSRSSSFVTPASAALIELPIPVWTHHSSLTVRLVVMDGGISSPINLNAYFDGITLELDNDLIFADDFEL